MLHYNPILIDNNTDRGESKMNKKFLYQLIDDEIPVTRDQLLRMIDNGVDLTNVNTSEIRDMSYLFFVSLGGIKGSITNWDTSKVTDMSNMFNNFIHFNEPLDWDTSSVTDMHGMFYQTDYFNQPLNWDTSNVRDMHHMFYLARGFNQNLSWDLSSMMCADEMFFKSEGSITRTDLKRK